MKLPKYIIKDYNIKNYNSFGIACLTKYFAIPKNLPELLKVFEFIKEKNIKHFILGNGTNVLFEEKYDGIVICLKQMQAKIYKNGFTVTASAGTSLFELCKFCMEKSLSGLEFCYGIPASIGGFVKMNGGAFGFTASDVIESITYLDNDLSIKTINREDIKFDIKKTEIEDLVLILSATFKVSSKPKKQIEQKMQEILEFRIKAQPYKDKSAGCFFRRTTKTFPAKVIDELGLKGLRLGDAMVSPVHAGFIVNIGEAKSRDIKKLAQIVQDIAKLNGYELKREVVFVE